MYAYHEQENNEEEEEEEEEPKLMKVDDDEAQKNKRLEKKRRLKERFNAEYDDGDATYFDDLKEEMQKQAEVRGHRCNMTCMHHLSILCFCIPALINFLLCIYS